MGFQMLVLVPYKLGLALYNYSTFAPGVCFPFFNGPPEIFIGQDARVRAGALRPSGVNRSPSTVSRRHRESRFKTANASVLLSNP
jgi:hypothetical protein